jgi:hypothetical protein
VNRPVAGLQVTLARLMTTGRVVGVASTKTDAAGRYTIRTRLAPGMGGYYALTAPTSDLQPGRSRLYGLLVPEAPVRPAPAVTAATVSLSASGSAGTYRLSGAVRPARGNVPVTLARVGSTGALVGVAATRTNAAGG